MKTWLIAFAFLASHGAVAATPEVEIRQAFERVIDAGGFRARVEGNVFGAGTPAVSGEIDVLFPNRIHVRGQDLEFIVLPSGAWVSALGLWAPTDRNLLPVTEFDAVEMRKAIASIRDVRADGRASTSQCEANAYRFRASGQLPGAAADGDVRAWVCIDSGRVARIEASEADSGRVVVDFDWTRRPEVSAP